MTTVDAAPRCPVVHGDSFNPFSLDPFRWLKVAQEEVPVFFMPETNMWWVTRYADAKQILGDPQTFSSRKVIEVAQLDPSVMDSFPDGHPINTGLVNMDPPAHTRVRKLTQRAFSPKVINERATEVRLLCDELVDAFVADGRADIVTQFSSLLPTTVILAIMGVPRERVAQFIEWDYNLGRMIAGAPLLPDDERLELSERAAEANVWLYEFVEQRQREPQDDLTSLLLQTTSDDGEPALTLPEVVSLISTLITAGSTTTKTFIPLTLQALLSHPDQWQAVQGDRSLLKRAVEEGLRLTNPMYGLNRLVTQDTEVGGVAIRAGETVFVHYATAQIDPRMFENPEEFDIRRHNVEKNIGFGFGIHTCLGAPLARLETRVALECFMDRLPGLRLVPDADMEWMPHFIGRSFRHLEVEWDV